MEQLYSLTEADFAVQKVDGEQEVQSGSDFRQDVDSIPTESTEAYLLKSEDVLLHIV